MKKYLTEMTGTFLLTLIFMVAGNVPNAMVWMPLGYAGLLAALTLSCMPVSGAHFNPVITFAVFLHRRIDKIDTIYYVVFQCAGAFLATLFGSLMLGAQGVTDLNPHATPAFIGFLSELIGTFALAYVWLATTKDRDGHTMLTHALALFLVLPGLMYAFSGISLAMFNPALAFGNMLLGTISASDWWLYIIGSGMGAAAAATLQQES
jgi:aquaporin Z